MLWLLLYLLGLPSSEGFWMAVPAGAPARGVVALQETGLRLGPAYVFTHPLGLPLVPELGVKGVFGRVALQVQGFAWIGDALVETLLPPVEQFQMDFRGGCGSLSLDFGTGVATYRLFASSQGTAHLLILGARLPAHLYLETAFGSRGLGPAVFSWSISGHRWYGKFGLLVSRARLLGIPLRVLPLVDFGRVL